MLDDACPTPGCNRVAVESELTEDAIGVFSDLWNLPHPWLGIVEPEWRDEGTEWACGRVHLSPLAACSELRVIEKFVDRPHSRVGDLRRLEPIDDLLSGLASKSADDDRLEIIVMFHP